MEGLDFACRGNVLMSTFAISVLTFTVVLGIGLLLLRPVLILYVDSYAVRVRARSRQDETAARKPQQSLVLALFRHIGEIVLTVLPAVSDRRTMQLLEQADYRTPQHLAIHTGVRAVVAGSGLFLAMVSATSNPTGLLLAIPTVVVGWLLPNFVLASRVTRRRQQIVSELPTILDLLIVCAQAGLGLLMGLQKVAQEVAEPCPVIAGELEQVLQEVKLFGKSTAVALRTMGERSGVDEVINLASALIAAEQKGSDISYPLRQQAEALRDRIKRKKEEEAAKVPVKMVPVIMVFIMPLIMAPMLGPAIVVIIDVFGQIGGFKTR